MLEEIAAWPLDAEGDDVKRYFQRPQALASLEAGDRPLIVGAAGAGKSAVAGYLASRGGVHRPTKRIAIKDALIAAFPRGAENGAARSRAFARYIVLFAAFEALIGEGKLEGSGIRKVARLFALDVGDRAEAALAHTFSPAVAFEVFGANPAPPGGRPSLLGGAAAIVTALAPIIDDRRVFTIFDEAEEFGPMRGALDALKADALDAFLRAIDSLSGVCGGLTPILVARRAVFDRVDPELRHDWTNRCFDIDWTSESLADLAAFRIARAASETFQPGQYTTSSVLRRVFRGAARRMAAEGGVKRDRIWPYVWRRTRGRARDMIHFIRTACRAALERGREEVDVRALIEADQAHAAYLRDSLVGELNGDWPQSEALLSVLSQIDPKGSDAVAFQRVIEARMSALGETEGVPAVRRFIDSLYEACAIGNARGARRRGGEEVFRIARDSDRFDYAAPVVVHRGLRPALEKTAA